MPLHLDGARLWESAPHWGRDLHEVAALADSVYVSFYKGLRGLAGAVVAGPADVMDEARQWRTRMGGTLYSLHPYAVAALRGLRLELPRMADYHGARSSWRSGCATGAGRDPDPPHTNAFRVHVPRPAAEVDERVVSLMERERVALTPPFRDADLRAGPGPSSPWAPRRWSGTRWRPRTCCARTPPRPSARRDPAAVTSVVGFVGKGPFLCCLCGTVHMRNGAARRLPRPRGGAVA